MKLQPSSANLCAALGDWNRYLMIVRRKRLRWATVPGWQHFIYLLLVITVSVKVKTRCVLYFCIVLKGHIVFWVKLSLFIKMCVSYSKRVVSLGRKHVEVTAEMSPPSITGQHSAARSTYFISNIPPRTFSKQWNPIVVWPYRSIWALVTLLILH